MTVPTGLSHVAMSVPAATLTDDYRTELLEFYGVKAQMLAPIVGGTELIGLVSVHYTPSPRHWTSEEIAALDRIAHEIQHALDEGKD